MKTLDKLIFSKQHGISITYIANLVDLNPATLTKWMRGEKGITHKNQQKIDIALQQLSEEIWRKIGDNNDRNL